MSARPIFRLISLALVAASLSLPAMSLRAATYYVATDGSDSNSGAIESPFATVQRAQTAANAGDTVYLRGGTYTMTEAQIAATSGIYSYVTNLNKSGSAGARINYWAYPGEQPVFDFTNVKPANQRVVAFNLSGSWIHVRGLEIIGVQVTITTHTQSECFENTGSNNIVEQCKMHDGMGIGFYLTRGANNLVLNCDAYRNWDSVSEGGVGGNVDGFGGHPNKTNYTDNVFRGCRAWFNSDDGFDCINAYATITFENCWSFFNGYTSDFVSRGDGNGFKSGGYGAAGGPVPSPIPRHMTRFCLAVRNKANGFYSNHHVGGSDWISNTAYQNGTNYNLLCCLADNDTDVAGYGHFMRNNLGFAPRSAALSNLDQAASDVASNYFTLPVTVVAGDFAATTTNTTQLEQFVSAPRQANGDLPETTLLHLVAGSDLIDAGAAVGYPFVGSSPDLGAFEFGATSNARTLVWVGDSSANLWDLQTTANFVNGTQPAKFGPTDALVFTDSGSASPSVTLSGQLWPGAVTVNATQNYTFIGSGKLGGTMSLTKSGSGKLTITGAHDYLGATFIAGGTLELTGSLNGSAVTVASGATLAGPGPITGNLTVQSGGTVNRNGTIAGSIVNAGTVAVTAGTLNVTGAITNSGTLRVTGGAVLNVAGAIANSGVLDLMTAGSAVPASLVNTGTVLTASNVKVRDVVTDGSGFSVKIKGYEGHDYRLQRTGSLGGAWSMVGAAQAGDGSVLTFKDASPGTVAGFYRITVSP
jgi:autotransporter-associated beta strand protein/parallel beta-helix repeat protein